MHVLSVNVTEPRWISIRGEDVETSIFKRPVDHSVDIGPLGIAEERRISARLCAAEDHAMYIYPHEHYASWAHELGVSGFPYGQFGENLTTQGLLESEVRVGDVFRCGGTVLRVRQPRLPCKKLDIRMGQTFLGRFLRSRRLGFYLSVLQTGRVQSGDPIELLERDPTAPSVDTLVRLTQIDAWDAVGLEDLLACRHLPDAWQRVIQDKLRAARSAEGWHGLREFEVIDKQPVCRDVITVGLRCVHDQPLPGFAPGQYLTVAYRAEDDRLLRRPYAITSSPNDLSCYRITVRRIRRPGAVSARLHDDVCVGDRVRVAAPRGDFLLKFAGPIQRGLLFIHDEVGVTSIMPLVREWSERLRHVPAFHVAIARGERLPLRHELGHAVRQGLESHLVERAPSAAWPGDNASDADADMLRGLATRVSHIYLAGESTFASRVAALLSGTPAQLRSERFGWLALD